MANTYFSFKQFNIQQDRCAMKVTTDACLFGAWASQCIKELVKEKGMLLDIGSGTGLLSLMIAQQHPALQFTAVEIDKDAVEQARENIQASPWENRITVIHEDINQFTAQLPFDLIISNPPFYQDDLRSPHEKKNRAHHDASLLVPELLKSIQSHLSEEGHYFLMMPFRRKQELMQLLKDHQLHAEQIVLISPAEKKEFSRVFVCGQKERNDIAKTTEKELVIAMEDGSYSETFKVLLKPYYLFL